jgi:hypothetical protein
MAMKRSLVLIFAGVAALNAHGATTIMNNKLYVDGQAWFVDGMVYQPEPRGWYTTNSQYDIKAGEGGAWLCTGAHVDNQNSWTSPCYDDDLTGLLPEGGDGKNLQYNNALKQRWQLDLDDMQRMGVNTLRLYNINTYNKSHTAFLDNLDARKMKVIYPVLTTYASQQSPDTAKGIITSIVQETCPSGRLHNAVLAYSIGNEFDEEILNNPNGNVAQNVHLAASIVRSLCPSAKITYSAVDNPAQWNLNANGKSPIVEAIGANNVDIISVNSGYRGDASNPASAGSYNQMFDQITALTQKYSKPFLISEMGAHDNETDGFNPHWWNYVWGIVVSRSQQANNMGVVYFEYNDEPLKKTLAFTQSNNDAYMGVTTGQWPVQGADPHDYSQTGNLANVQKTANYQGIPNYLTDDNRTIAYPGSNHGAGRYEMFVSDNQGINACNYKYSPNPFQIESTCTTAVNSYNLLKGAKRP